MVESASFCTLRILENYSTSVLHLLLRKAGYSSQEVNFPCSEIRPALAPLFTIFFQKCIVFHSLFLQTDAVGGSGMRIVTCGVTAALSFSVIWCGAAFASKESIISDKNEFGGKTIEVIIEKGEAPPEVQKILASYDEGGGMRRTEITYTEAFSSEKGVARTIEYLDPEGKVAKREYYYTDAFGNKKGVARAVEYYYAHEKIAKAEFIYTDTFAKEKGVMRGTEYYDENGKVVKAEFSYTDAFAKEQGVTKRIEYYDADGKSAKREFYRDNILIRGE